MGGRHESTATQPSGASASSKGADSQGDSIWKACAYGDFDVLRHCLEQNPSPVNQVSCTASVLHTSMCPLTHHHALPLCTMLQGIRIVRPRSDDCVQLPLGEHLCRPRLW